MWLSDFAVGQLFLPQSLPKKRFSAIDKECGYARYIYNPRAPKCCVITQMLGRNTANQYAKSHPDIPRNKHRRVGGASLVVGGKVDKHSLK